MNQKFIKTQINFNSNLVQFNLEDLRGKQGCQLCWKNFGFGTREHQCKRCKRSTCSNCASDQMDKHEQAHRICKQCQKEVEFLNTKFTSKKIKFNTDSNYSSSWFQSLGCASVEEHDLNQYEYFLEDYIVENFQEDALNKETISMVFESLLDSLPYSIIQLVIISTDNNLEIIKKPLENLCISFNRKNPHIGFSSQLLQLGLFLLCLTSEQNAFCILTQIFEDLIPIKIYPKTQRDQGLDFQTEVSIVMSYATEAFQKEEFNDNQKLLVQQMLEIDYLRLSWSLGITFMNLECFFNMFTRMCEKKKFDQFQKIFLAILKLSVNNMIETKNDIMKLQIYSLRYVKWEGIEEKARIMDLNSNEITTSSLRKKNQEKKGSKIKESEIYLEIQQKLQSSEDFAIQLQIDIDKYQKALQKLQLQNIEQDEQLRQLKDELDIKKQENFKLKIDIDIKNTVDPTRSNITSIPLNHSNSNTVSGSSIYNSNSSAIPSEYKLSPKLQPAKNEKSDLKSIKNFDLDNVSETQIRSLQSSVEILRNELFKKDQQVEELNKIKQTLQKLLEREQSEQNDNINQQVKLQNNIEDLSNDLQAQKNQFKDLDKKYQELQSFRITAISGELKRSSLDIQQKKISVNQSGAQLNADEKHREELLMIVNSQEQEIFSLNHKVEQLIQLVEQSQKLNSNLLLERENILIEIDRLQKGSQANEVRYKRETMSLINSNPHYDQSMHLIDSSSNPQFVKIFNELETNQKQNQALTFECSQFKKIIEEQQREIMQSMEQIGILEDSKQKMVQELEDFQNILPVYQLQQKWVDIEINQGKRQIQEQQSIFKLRDFNIEFLNQIKALQHQLLVKKIDSQIQSQNLAELQSQIDSLTQKALQNQNEPQLNLYNRSESSEQQKNSNKSNTQEEMKKQKIPASQMMMDPHNHQIRTHVAKEKKDIDGTSDENCQINSCAIF